MTATGQFIEVLANLKTGELGLLRTHSGQGLDNTVDGFDLFSGLWWPLRQKTERAPRREVAWLVSKLFASSPMPQSDGDTLPRQLARCRPIEEKARERFQTRFDQMLNLRLNQMESALQWAIDQIASNKNIGGLDWVRLTDDLSIWQRETTRLKWAEQYIQTSEREKSC